MNGDSVDTEWSAFFRVASQNIIHISTAMCQPPQHIDHPLLPIEIKWPNVTKLNSSVTQAGQPRTNIPKSNQANQVIELWMKERDRGCMHGFRCVPVLSLLHNCWTAELCKKQFRLNSDRIIFTLYANSLFSFKLIENPKCYIKYIKRLLNTSARKWWSGHLTSPHTVHYLCPPMFLYAVSSNAFRLSQVVWL